MKFRQRIWIMCGLCTVFIILYFRNLLHRSAVNLANVNVELPSMCWSRLLYPSRDNSTLQLYSIVNKTKPNTPIYLSSMDNEFAFVNKMPRHRTPMTVFVIPHSHNDPAWIQTFQAYYQGQTKPILNYILKYLAQYPDMTFLWTEPVFLDKYFQTLSPPRQRLFRQLLDEGRLEIAAGGWISPDEATPSNYALISQMTEGLWWLQSNLNYTPETYWNIDPFGYSQTMPFLLRKAAFRHVNVVRVNEKVKELLRRSQTLEFNWNAFWDRSRTGIFTSVLPFMLYNIKYSCGPGSGTCLMFDFRRIDGEFSESVAVPITNDNLKRHAELLYKQFELKSRMYRHSVVAFPIGDDFRFDRALEWEQQYTNFKLVMDYMNARSDMNVKIRFGTIRDYYQAVGSAKQNYPSMEGDFYTYTDRDEAYWTGYFTTRMILKRRIRIAENWLRAAETLSVLLRLQGGRIKVSRAAEEQITTARRHFAFLQHHDAIAGTSKPFVMDTYYQKIVDLLLLSSEVIEKALKLLSGHLVSNFHDAQESEPVLEHDIANLLLFNSREEDTHECFRFQAKTSSIAVMAADGEAISCQINPSPRPNAFEVVFCLALPGLGTRKVSMFKSAKNNCVVATVYSNNNTYKGFFPGVKKVQLLDKTFSVESKHLGVSFQTSNALPVALDLRTAHPPRRVRLRADFFSYQGTNSGAYIFGPDREKADPYVMTSPTVTFYDGPVEGGAIAQNRAWIYRHRLVKNDLNPFNRALRMDVEFLPDQMPTNAEIVYRVTTPAVSSGEHFFTDSNGLAMTRRRRLSAMVLQANFYPATTAAMLDDRRAGLRLNLLLSQSMGATSIQSGSLEVMLSRMPDQDDTRGLGEGVTETEPIRADLVLLLEECEEAPVCGAAGARHQSPRGGEFLSRRAAALERSLNRPPLLLRAHSLVSPGPATWSWFGSESSLSSFFQVTNVRALPTSQELLLVLRRPGQSVCHQRDDVAPITSDGMRLQNFVRALVAGHWKRVKSARLTTLTGIGPHGTPLTSDKDWSNVTIDVNDLVAVLLRIED